MLSFSLSRWCRNLVAISGRRRVRNGGCVLRSGLESLEERILLAIRPTAAVFLGGTPLNTGTVLTSQPASLDVVFSENVSGAGTASNYVLTDNTGTTYPLGSVSYSSANDTATLSLPSGMQDGRAYTLLIAGDKITGVGSGLSLSLPGQVVVANSQTNNTSIIDLPGNGTLQALANYPIPSLNPSTTNPEPVSATATDLNGNGIPDLVVADSASGTLNIHLGRGNGVFDITAAVTLDLLPSNTTAAAPSALAITSAGGKPMIVVAESGTGQVSVFLETAPLIFTLNTFSCWADPVGLALADFNSDSFPDIAVANHVGVPISGGTGFTVNVLLANGAGTYGAATAFQVGSSTTSTTGVTSPTGIAAGGLNNSSTTDLAVSGGNSTVGVLLNTTTAGAATPTFTKLDVANSLTTTTTSVAIGKIDGGPNNAIIAETANGPIVFQNSGGANFGTASTGGGGVPLYPSEFGGSPVSPGSSPAAFVLDPNSGTGLNDLLVANARSPGSVTYVQNTSFSSTISRIRQSGTTSNDSIRTASVAGLSNGAIIEINGDPSSSINGVWTISNVNIANKTFEIPLGWVSDQDFGPGVNWHVVRFSTSFTTTPVDANPGSIALVDINTDGKADLLTGNATNGDVTVALGRGSGAFQTSTDVTLAPPANPATPSAVAVGDLNNDGIADLAVADSNNSKVWVFIGNGDTTYKAPVGYSTLTVSNLGHAPIAVVMANLGGAGVDIVTLSQADDVVSILPNNGSGVFGTPTTFAVSATPITGQTPTALVAGNFGFNNNATDLAIGYAIAGTNDGGVSILLGVAGQARQFTYPNFTPSQPPITGIAVTALATGNFTNASGELDLAVAGSTTQSSGNVVFFYPIAGSGGFFTEQFAVSQTSSAGAYSNLPSISSLAAGDVNRDGYTDVVAVSNSTTTDSVFVLQNESAGGFSAFTQLAAVPPGASLQSVAVMNVPGNVLPNLIVSTTGQGGRRE